MTDQIKLLRNENEQLQDMMLSQQLMLQKQSSIQQKEIESKDTQLTELQKVVHTQEEQIQGIEKRLADMLAQVQPFCVTSYHHVVNLLRLFIRWHVCHWLIIHILQSRVSGSRGQVVLVIHVRIIYPACTHAQQGVK
jgi:beta-phosphoglucomutase-like phosphatase (HAD superfamily)